MRDGLGASWQIQVSREDGVLPCTLPKLSQGFVEFHLLKGPEAEDYTLYASHTVWESRAVFEAWTKSEAFRAAHSRAGDNKPLYLDHPQFEGFEVRQTVGRGKAA